MAEIEYSERAADWLRDVEPDIQEQVMKRIEQAQDFPDPLRGSEYYKLRAGEYRAIINWQRNTDPEGLFVREIGHRSTIYD